MMWYKEIYCSEADNEDGDDKDNDGHAISQPDMSGGKSPIVGDE